MQLLQLGYCNQGIFCGMSMLECIVSPRHPFNVENNDYMAPFLTPPPFSSTSPNDLKKIYKNTGI